MVVYFAFSVTPLSTYAFGYFYFYGSVPHTLRLSLPSAFQ